MEKIIQLISLGGDDYLYLCDYKDGELYYRTSFAIKHLQTDTPLIEGNKVYIGLHYFPLSLLIKFTEANNITV